MLPLASKRIVLGVTGSIACYKAADLASKLTQLGAEVDVILTTAAEHFIKPLTFQSVTGRRAYVDKDLWGPQGHVLHVKLGKDADLVLVAPATANTLSKLAAGQADNLLTLTILAATAPLMLAPAMDGGMYDHPATQASLEAMHARGARIHGPVSGHLASGLSGVGRMLEPAELAGYARVALGAHGALSGRRVLVTAGGTQEPIDPVRVIANRSSGKQGYALAQAALDMGAQVTLISGPTALSAPVGAELVRVQTAVEMRDAVLAHAAHADALLMAAAVADFRPSNTSDKKIKRAEGVPTVELAANPDILKEVSQQARKPRVLVGFAAESNDLLSNAQGKLASKGLDMIVANDVSAHDAGFEVDTNRVILLSKDGTQEELPLMSKYEVAHRVLEKVAGLLK
ncbi:MAG TPA: bifunctional phosphopantothenoylcysteine decarboxylase/phosphopantothenate--cysteine ligase CoaBC [Anaerolineales bacterium]|nr:bifunctional phosphopantothenoylcysteine decarboxylase/phosphopantothenate--cysteine ligase CoaBC [Anaerolineales bacterium]HRQ92471.1 bifunctional phosphopantothenoylcysteine decarboxylase/phosphopantothenate--cysteine ligase CoaBC [Anaerolineales bacterium]